MGASLPGADISEGCSEPAPAVGGEGTGSACLTPQVSQRGIPNPHLSGLETSSSALRRKSSARRFGTCRFPFVIALCEDYLLVTVENKVTLTLHLLLR